MYRSYSVNDMPQPIRYSGNSSGGNGQHRNKSPRMCDENIHTDNVEPCPPPVEGPLPEECQIPEEISPAECPAQNLPQTCPARNCSVRNCPAQANNKGGLLSGLNLKNDDLILLAVAVILLMDGCDDKLLIAALGLVFFSEYL